jgi:predicted Rossmann fold nucleotide-binding protein DprA/Smf involved in DNA uptake
MQKLNKCIASLALSTLCLGAANAQNSGSTLEQAIEMARAIKAGELGLRTPAAQTVNPRLPWQSWDVLIRDFPKFGLSQVLRRT